MVSGGQIRPHWRRVFGTVSDLGAETLAERGRHLDRLLTEEGLTSLLPGESPVRLRCDPIPLLLNAAEFAALEAGLAQRAELLERVLADIHGPQELLASGALPPAIVHANPAFLRSARMRLDGVEAPPQRHLQVYAADLLRGPDGAWRVLADRTADAAGAGYAIENRRALARALPELFRAERQVMRLEPFFEAWQDSLERLAPAGAAPTLALLTPGPADKLWFEHVVLARELSCALVQDGDLTVRDGILHVKTLNGLRRVAVLLRRQDGRTLDPLEQDPGSAGGGVPGLLDAARTGALCIVNAPGAGFAEAPALAAFLPALARRLLGEALRLPGAEALWLAEEAARARVLADPGAWRLRSAQDGRARPVPIANLSAAGRARLLGLLAATPAGWIACAPVQPSVAPCLGPGGLVPQPVALRMFLLHDGTGWRAMPGGLGRALTEADAAAGRLPLHGLAKDVWVLAEDATAEIRGPARAAAAPLPIRRAAGELPSRVADDFFWLGRYLERAEAAARLLRVTAERLDRPAPTPREQAEIRSLSECLIVAGLAMPEAVRGVGAGVLASELLVAARPGGALPGLLRQVSRIAERLRDRLTEEVHAIVGRGLAGLVGTLEDLPPAHDPGRRGLEPLQDAMAVVLGFSATVAGLAAENMVRGGGRLFLDLGRRVERAQAVAAEIACLLDQPGATAQPARLEPGLRLALVLRDSVITYRSRYLSLLQPAPVLDLVLADEGNPRGLAFQLAAARDLLAGLGREGASEDPGLAASAGGLLDAARALPAEVAAAPDPGLAAAQLPPRLRGLATEVAGLSDGITRLYFALLPAPRSLGLEGEARRLRGAA
jgi:uncharacterized circularly permuted ATP-grasp superfamily protein/uncharacterized alpha-E superfamily protein